MEPTRCRGCGAVLQREDPLNEGYVVKDFKVPPGLNTTFSTIQAFKGLENVVVIITDVEDFSSEKLMYVGLSRACSGLFILESDAAKREYDNLLISKLLK